MKKEELRIGNWVDFNGKHYQISSIHSDDTIRLYDADTTIGCFHLRQIKPITITLEWLLKLGFVKSKQSANHDVFAFYEKGEYAIQILFQSNTFIFIHLLLEVAPFPSKYGLGTVESIHMLQNLYFSLTGSELTLK